MNRFSKDMRDELDCTFGNYFGSMQQKVDSVYNTWSTSQGWHMLNSETMYFNGEYGSIARDLHEKFLKGYKDTIGWVYLGHADLPDECKHYDN